MKAVIYARVSSLTDRQNPERQVKDLSDYANRNNIEIAKIFEEKTSGNKKNSERPILSAALEYAQAANVDLFMVSELSRLGRNIIEVQNAVNWFIQNKINLYIQKEDFSILDDNKQPKFYISIIIAVLSTCASLERENISYRLNSGRKNYIAKGGKVGRPKDNRSLESKKEELQQKYNKVIRDLRKGTSIRDTAKLNRCSPATVQKIKKMFC